VFDSVLSGGFFGIEILGERRRLGDRQEIEDINSNMLETLVYTKITIFRAHLL